jgi:hypothetical protein
MRWYGLIDLAQDRDQWSALVNTAMNLRVSQHFGKFLRSTMATSQEGLSSMKLVYITNETCTQKQTCEENEETLISCRGWIKQRQVYHSTDLICRGNLEGATSLGARRLLVCYLLTILQIMLTEWAGNRKRIGKHVPKCSRRGAHCHATVRVL